MENTLPLAILCGPCQQVFEGHWAPKESLETASPAGRIEELDRPSGDSPADKLPLREGTSLSSEDDFYENPDWVKVVATDKTDTSPLKTTSSLSPRHLSIQSLEESALNGCHLCTTIWDRVSNRVGELETSTKEDLSRLIGVIIVRPSNEDIAGQGSVALDVSYFIDGEIAQNTYVFTADFLLVDHKGAPSFPSNLSVRDAHEKKSCRTTLNTLA
ncbi:hypothetical protein GP486_002736 [Trichoglossum hirsutum]|uniref:Uncharacterized protein n=1 Tax=Trichoglossum hirsutum TaxID=265104 RepID=A0A9P8LEH3_9PEZI|nr:hypothetical protein GP486_002736 [Trichoglossum hirsutum]